MVQGCLLKNQILGYLTMNNLPKMLCAPTDDILDRRGKEMDLLKCKVKITSTCTEM